MLCNQTASRHNQVDPDPNSTVLVGEVSRLTSDQAHKSGLEKLGRRAPPEIESRYTGSRGGEALCGGGVRWAALLRYIFGFQGVFGLWVDMALRIQGFIQAQQRSQKMV